MNKISRYVFGFISLLYFMEVCFADESKQKKSGNDDAFTAIMSTKFEFGEAGINGESKAPDDFFLRGKQSQSMSQMVGLRSAFKRKLRNSRYGVKSLTR